MEHYHIHTWRTLIKWLLFSIGIVVLGSILTSGWVLFSLAISLVPASEIAWILEMILVGAIWGFAIGLVQRYMLRKFFHWDAHGWRRASIIGGVLGAIVTTFMPIFGYFTFYVPMYLPYVITISVIQWLVLRHVVRFAWIWILAWVVAPILYINSWHSMSFPFYLMIIGALVAVLIPGIVMLDLFKHHRRSGKS
jgi:hypothetical protein